MSICNCNNNTVVGRAKCPVDRVVTPGDSCPMAPTTIEFEVETPTNFISGLDGKSAYEYATEGGYQGDEQQFYSDLGSIGTFKEQLSDFDDRLTEIEEHGLVGKYLLEADTFEGLTVDDGTRVMYIGPTTETYTNGLVYVYSASEGSWSEAVLQRIPEIPDIDEIRSAASAFTSFYNDKDYVDTTINKWEELRDFLEGMTDQDTLTGKLAGMRENLEQQIADKQNEITGAASTITDVNLTANKALVSNAQGKVAVSAVSATELSYLSGVTRGIQTQIDGKQDELTFDNAPTVNSTNPVTSDGIKRAIDNAIQQAEENPRALRQVADLGSYAGQLGDIVQYTGPTTAKYTNGWTYKNAAERKTITVGTKYVNITDDSLAAVGIPRGIYYKLPDGTTDEVTINLRWWFWTYKNGNANIKVPFSTDTIIEGHRVYLPTVGATIWIDGAFAHITSYAPISVGDPQPSSIELDNGVTLTRSSGGDGGPEPESASYFYIYLSAAGHKLYKRQYYEDPILVNEKYPDGVYQVITTNIKTSPVPTAQYVAGTTAEETVIELGGWQQWNVQPQTDISGKQDVLTFDASPTLGSTNPVTSNGIRLAIDAASALNRLRFATAASVSNNLSTVDTSTYSVNDMLTITDLGSGVLRYMASGVQRTFTGPFDFDLMFRWTGTEFRPMFPFMNWNEYN